MGDNTLQIGQILDRLIRGSHNGTVNWSDGVAKDSYQTRFGNFLIVLSGNGYSPPSANMLATNVFGTMPIRLEIKKLDGRSVATVGGNQMANAFTPGYPQEVLSKVASLYNIVADRSEDLDELLKLLK